MDSHNHNGKLINPSSIEFSGSSTHGGYIDFHYGKTTNDYSTRLIERSDGILSLLFNGNSAYFDIIHEGNLNAVSQGGVSNQGINKVYIGWATDASGIRCTVDITDMGYLVKSSIVSNINVGTSAYTSGTSALTDGNIYLQYE